LEKGVLLIEVHTLPQSGILHVVYNEISIDLHSWLRIFFFLRTFFRHFVENVLCILWFLMKYQERQFIYRAVEL
jgi:hypothetical protein